MKSRLKLDCSAHPETFPAGPEAVTGSTLTNVSLLTLPSFQRLVLRRDGEEGRFGDVASEMSVPAKALAAERCRCLSPKTEQSRLRVVLDAAVVFSRSEFRKLRSKRSTVQVTQGSFTRSNLHGDTSLIIPLCASLTWQQMKKKCNKTVQV